MFSADEVGPLIRLRFKLGKLKKVSRAASEIILENEMHGMRKRNPEGRNV